MVRIFYSMNNATTSFGERLRQLRRNKGWTQTELGQRVGLSKRMVIHYEKHSKNPPADKAAAFATALGVKVDTLLRGNGKVVEPSVDPKFARKLEKAKALPPNDQQVLTSLIDGLLRKHDNR